MLHQVKSDQCTHLLLQREYVHCVFVVTALTAEGSFHFSLALLKVKRVNMVSRASTSEVLKSEPKALFIYLIIHLFQLVFSVRTVFFSPTNQSEQYFGLFFQRSERD